jgi:hypothetical protein
MVSLADAESNLHSLNWGRTLGVLPPGGEKELLDFFDLLGLWRQHRYKCPI